MVVQEIIGGWYQNSCFEGSYEECLEYIREHSNNSYVINEIEEVDYL